MLIVRIFSALKAGLTLLVNPKRVDALLKLGDLLTFTGAFDVSLKRARRDPRAVSLMQSRYGEIQPNLKKLKTYPKTTLGYQFSQHLGKNGLQNYQRNSERRMGDKNYLKERTREIHDILHVVLGYGIDLDDEVALNAVLVAQFQNPVSTLVIGGAILHTFFKSPSELPRLFSKIVEGWNRGLQLKSVLAVRWEDNWHTSVEALRRELIQTDRSTADFRCGLKSV